MAVVAAATIPAADAGRCCFVLRRELVQKLVVIVVVSDRPLTSSSVLSVSVHDDSDADTSRVLLFIDVCR